MKKALSIRKSYNFAWTTFKNNWIFWLALSLISAILSSPQNIVNTTHRSETWWGLVGFLFWILSLVVGIGIIKISLNVYDKKKVEILDIFRATRYFWRYLGAGILYALLVAAGLILLIVPGIYWALKYSMTINLIIDKDLGIREAFHQSGVITQGVKWRLILFSLAMIGVMILGGILLGVGILVAIPLNWLAGIHIYRQMLKQSS